MGKAWFHILGVVVIGFWGMTFISSKILLLNGLRPAEIFFIRFAVAYAGLAAFDLARCHRSHRRPRLWSDSLTDELLMVLVGITGGSVYFMCENAALEYTQACNVSFIVCCAPLPTVFLTKLWKRCFRGEHVDRLEDVRIGPMLVAGTVMAVCGLAMIVFNGHRLHISPLGDMLALGGCLCWALYSIYMGSLTEKYGTVFATRKVFFYGLVTVIPFLFLHGTPYPDHSVFLRPAVAGNLLFLGVCASLLCYVLWNVVMVRLGNVTSSYYVYLNPVFTMTGSILILHERITLLGVAGSFFILAGVILAGAQRKGE